jgi:hypothetical protein
LVSIGKEDMLKLRREREMCHNIHEWIVYDKLSPNFQLRWWGKKVGSGHYGTKCWVVDFLGQVDNGRYIALTFFFRLTSPPYTTCKWKALSLQ